MDKGFSKNLYLTEEIETNTKDVLEKTFANLCDTLLSMHWFSGCDIRKVKVVLSIQDMKKYFLEKGRNCGHKITQKLTN